MKEAVRHIVGTQFRNMATVGGSISGRFGFSDIWTLFLALDAQVELYKGGIVSLADFGQTGPGKDIVTHIIIRKRPAKRRMIRCASMKRTSPVIAVAVSADAENVRCAIGARPARAEVVRLPAADVRRQGLEGAAQQIAHP